MTVRHPPSKIEHDKHDMVVQECRVHLNSMAFSISISFSIAFITTFVISAINMKTFDFTGFGSKSTGISHCRQYIFFSISRFSGLPLKNISIAILLHPKGPQT